MSEIGSKMFTGAGIGAAAGAIGGGIYGGIKAHQKIENLPTETVTLPGYDRPLYEERYVGRDSHINIDFSGDGYSGAHSYDVTAKFPLKNADGSVKMEHIPSQNITGHGKAVINDKMHPIQEPSGVRTHTNVGNNYGDGVNVNSHTTVDYKTIGYWKEPTVEFETGVSRFGHIMGYAAAGAVVGALGGALVAAAIDKAGG